MPTRRFRRTGMRCAGTARARGIARAVLDKWRGRVIAVHLANLNAAAFVDAVEPVALRALIELRNLPVSTGRGAHGLGYFLDELIKLTANGAAALGLFGDGLLNLAWVDAHLHWGRPPFAELQKMHAGAKFARAWLRASPSRWSYDVATPVHFGDMRNVHPPRGFGRAR